MATRLTPLGSVVKWLVVPVAAAYIGFAFIAPRLRHVSLPAALVSAVAQRTSPATETAPGVPAAITAPVVPADATPVPTVAPTPDQTAQTATSPGSPGLSVTVTPKPAHHHRRRRHHAPKSSPKPAEAQAPADDVVPAPPADDPASGSVLPP